MLNVIVIEDDANIARLHCHFIGQCPGFNVIGTASTIEVAKQLIEQGKPDLVIVDNYLPDGRGIDLVMEWLNSGYKHECILVTAANDVTTVQLAYRYGAFDYLVKPIDYDRLTESLTRFSQVKHTLAKQKNLHQRQLDDLFRPSHSSASQCDSSDSFTLKLVLGLFPHTNLERTAHEVATELGVSKSTARRYLDKAVEHYELQAFLSHGKVGRPTRYYRRVTKIS